MHLYALCFVFGGEMSHVRLTGASFSHFPPCGSEPSSQVRPAWLTGGPAGFGAAVKSYAALPK